MRMRTKNMKRAMLLLMALLFSFTEAHSLWTYFIKKTETIGPITYNVWYRKYSGFAESRAQQEPLPGVGDVTQEYFDHMEVTAKADYPYHYQGYIDIPSTVEGYGAVTSIAGGAFKDCGAALVRVDIPASVYVKSGAFTNCIGLSEVHTACERNIADDAFDEYIYEHATLFVPKGRKAVYEGLGGWKNFKIINDGSEDDELQEGDTFTAKTAEGVDVTYTVKDTNRRRIYIGRVYYGVPDPAIDSTYAGEVTIPEEVNGYEVAGLESGAFYLCKKVTHIHLPAMVENIGAGAFAQCQDLMNVNIPNGVKTIGEEAFSNCTSLTSVSIPEGVTAISDYTFLRCTALSDVSLPSTIKTIGKYAFSYCESLKSISIPSGVTTISDYAFLRCTYLRSITLPSSLKEIGIGVFGLSGLLSINLPSSLEKIGTQAFYGCSNLKALTIPYKVETLGEVIVGYCNDLKSLTVDSSNPYFRSSGNGIIDKSTNMMIHSCPATVIPTDIVGISRLGFACVPGVEEIVIPDNVKTLGAMAFEECINLKRVTIPATIESIAEEAFLQCESLEQVTMLNPIPVAITDNVFHMNETQNSDNTGYTTSDFTTATLYVPYGSKAAYQQAAGWKNFQNIVEMEAPDITIALSENAKIGNYWYAANTSNRGTDDLHIYPSIYGQAGVNICDWTYGVYSTFMSGKPQLTVSGADASEVTPLLAFRSVGVLQASSDGDALLCYADTIAKVNSETGEVTMVMSASTKRLLNQAASDDFVNALTLPLCIKARYNGTVYDVEGGDFAAKVMRPINAEGKELAQQDITTGSVTLNLGELVTLTDWRDYSINKRGLFDFYDIESITVTGATNSSNVGSAIKANVNGSWVSVSSATDKLAFTYQPRSLWDNADGAMPDYGTLTVANSGFSGDMQLSIPVTVSYAWGEVQTTAYVTVTAEAEEPDLKVEEFYVEGDGIVGTRHSIYCEVKNYGATYTGSIYLHVINTSAIAPNTLLIWANDIPKNYMFTRNIGVTFVEEGAFRIWLSTDEEGNDVIGETTWIVTPAATLTAKSYTREYGEENPDFGFTADKGGFSGTPKIACTADRYSDVGTYDIVIEQGSVDNNYVTLVPGTLTITKAPLTIAAGDWLNRQGKEPKDITPFYGSFKNGENKSVLTKEPQFTTTATASSPMGSVHQLTFSGAEAKNYAFTYIPGTITIIGRPGDVNRDSYINTTDAVDVIQQVLGYNVLPHIFDGDLYPDDEITTADLQQVVSYILNEDRAAARRTAPVTAINSRLGLTLDEQGRLAVTLQNDMPLTGFQFDVTLPNGADLSQVQLSELRRNGHSVAMRHMDDGSYRVLVYSMQNTALRGSDGMLATLLTSAIDGDVALSNIHVVDEQCADHRLPDVSLSMLTGISTLTEDTAPFDIYDLNGRLVRRNATSTKGLHRGVYMINSQKVIIK